jgi:hypothetical protein
MRPAVAESLEPQQIDRPASLAPSPLGRLQEADRTAHVELAATCQFADLSFQIDPRALLTDKDFEALADAVAQALGQPKIPPTSRCVKHAERRVGPGQGEREREDRSDANPAGK